MVDFMIFNNKYFKASIILVICQQIFLALSTWFIAKSGYYLTSGNYKEVKITLILFFIFAVLGYIVSSFVSILTIKSKNLSWKRYTKATIGTISLDINISSNDNLKKIISWINSEAPSTLGGATNFYIQFISIILNIIFTFIVFYIMLGKVISSILLIALIISILLVLFLKEKVKNSSSTLQEKNLAIFTYIEPYIHKNYFGNSSMRSDANHKLDFRMNNYFSNLIKYSYLEQLIACLPIVVGVSAIIIYLIIIPVSDLTVLLGAIVAVLPRTLQLFGNVHALSLYSTQYIMIRVKLDKLTNFVKSLSSYSIKDNLNFDLIKILKGNESVNPKFLLEKIKNSDLSNGRYLVYGDNGSGKSSLLKFIKSMDREAILISPNTFYSENNESLSTGMFQIKQINEILKQESKVILLDEWDANLDSKNVALLDRLFNERSLNHIIIEVRHKHIL